MADDLKAHLRLVAEIEGLHKVKRQLARVAEEGVKLHMDERSLRELKDLGTSLDKDLRGIFKEARELKLGEAAVKQMSATVRDLDTRMSSAVDDLEEAHRMFNRMATKQNAEKIAAAEREVALVGKMISLESQSLRQRLGERERAIGDMMEFQKKGALERARIMSESAQDFLETLSRGDVRGAGGMLQQAGEAGELAASMKGMKGMGKMMPKLVAGMGSVAAALGTIAAIAGPILLVAKAVHSVDAAGKELNRTFMQGAAVSDMYWGDNLRGTGKVTDGFVTLQQAASDFWFNAGWRTSQEEVANIITAFNEEGLTIKKITGGLEDQTIATQKLQEATASALTYSTLLGVEQNQMATQMGEWSDDMVQSLSEVREGLSTINKLAMESGFGTKRFYTMVQQATTGVGLYNVRLEEASNLLFMLGKAMSPRVAGQFLQTLSKGFTDKSMTSRFQEIMIVGTKKIGNILTKDAGRMAERFTEEFGKTEELAETLKGAGLDVTMQGDEFVEKLRGMEPTAQRKLIAEVSAQGKSGIDAAKRLSQLVELSHGAGKDAKLGDMAIASSQMSMAGKLTAALQTFGGDPISELSAIQLAAHENMRGMSMEQIEELRALDKQLRGQFELLQDSSKQEQIAQMSREEQIKKFGGFLQKTDEGYKVMTGTIKDGNIINAKAAGSFDDFTLGQADLMAAGEAQFNKDQQIAMEVVRNTRDVANILEAGTNALLMDANKALIGIWGWATGQKDNAKFIEASMKKQEELQQQSVTKQEELRKLREDFLKADADQKRELKKQIKTTEDGLKETKMLTEIEKAKEEAVRSGARGQDAEAQAIQALKKSGRLKSMLTERYGEEEAEKRMAAASAAGQQEVRRTREAVDASIRMGGYADGGRAFAASQRTMGSRMEKKYSTEAYAKGLFADLPGAPEEEEEMTNEEMAEALGMVESETQTKLEEGNKENKKGLDKLAKNQKKSDDERVKDGADSILLADAKRTISRLGLGGTDAERAKLAEGLMKGQADVVASVRSRAGQMGELDPELAKLLRDFKAAPTGADFIWRAGQGFAKFSSQDNLVGVKGDPVQAAAGAGGGGHVTININGGDPKTVYETVKRALRNSGVRPPPGG